MSMRSMEGIKRGDYIQVTPLEKDAGGTKDFGVITGAALTDLAVGGGALFAISVQVGDEQVRLDLNCNLVDVSLLFSAGIARGN